MRDKQKDQYGLTLIELMVSLAVGLLVTGIVLAMFAQSKRSFIQDDAIAVMQENGRFALQILSNELLHAGLAGNMHIADTVVNPITAPLGTDEDCTTAWFDVFATPIEYYETPPTALNCFDDAEAFGDRSVLIVKRTAQQPTTTLQSDTLYLSTNGIGLNICDSSANPCNVLQDNWEYYVHIYYIADGTDGVPGLYRKRLIYTGNTASVSNPEEIVPGIADFSIQYGVDDDNDNIVRALGYTTALSAANSPLSVATRISVLAHSLNEDFSKTNTRQYSLYPYETTYSGYGLTDSNYYGRVFSTSVMVRNNAYRMSSSLITLATP